MNRMFETLRVGVPTPTLSIRIASVGAALFLLLGAAAGFHAGSAHAAACGDDVDGRRIPCACGDVVVSDTRLQATDPVTTDRCSRDGLFLRARAGARSLRLDVAGLSILGTGIGSGIRVVDGGDLGALITGGDAARGQIAGFDTGIFAHGRDAVAEVRNLTVQGNVSDGVVIRSSGVKVTEVTAHRNGRDGLRISGHGSELSGVEATSNNNVGLRLDGSANNVQARLSDNGKDGARIGGRGHDLTRVKSSGNRGRGIVLSGDGHKVDRSRTKSNEGGDIVGPGVPDGRSAEVGR